MYVRISMLSKCQKGLQATKSLLYRQHSISRAEVKPVTLYRLFQKAAFVSLWLYEVAFTITFNPLLPNMYHLSRSERNTRAQSPMVPAGATCCVRLQSSRVDSWPLSMRKWCCCAAATADVIFPMDHVENVQLYSSSDFKGNRSLGICIIWPVNQKVVARRLRPSSSCADCVNLPFYFTELLYLYRFQMFFTVYQVGVEVFLNRLHVHTV